MKCKNLLITLLLPLIIGVTSCTTEGGKNSSSKGNDNSSSSVIINSSSSTSSPNKQSSVSTDIQLPSDALEFVNAVNSIALNQDAGYYINEAFGLYDSLENWNYPEVIDAFDKLLLLEELYNDYVKQNNAVESFIQRVDDIPYDLDISDERAIVLAEEAYAKLNDAQKEMLGVSQAYERLSDARNDFDILYAQTIEDAKNASAKGFTDLVDVIPEVSLITLNNGEAIEIALNHYETLSDDVKEMEIVIDAYERLLAAEARYNELVEDPSLNDDILATSFIAAVAELPSKDAVTLDDRVDIFNANDIYKSLPATTKLVEEVANGYTKVLEDLKAYYDLYLDSQGLQRDDTTPSDVTIINTVDDLLAIENNLSGSYRLGADIDLENMEWQNLGVFTGTLDGAGHTIYNMARSSSSEDASFALFLEVQKGAVVKNLSVEGKVTGVGCWEGSIAIRNYGTISNCLINLDISSPTMGHIGGIVCENHSGGVIENCIVLSNINGGNLSGGISVGQYGTVKNSYVLSTNVSSGWMVGNSNDYNKGAELLPECAKTEAELKQASLYTNFDKSIWCIIDGYYPTLVR